MKETAVRLWILTFFFAAFVAFHRNFDGTNPLLLFQWGMLTFGITVYGIWTFWKIWQPHFKSHSLNAHPNDGKDNANESTYLLEFLLRLPQLKRRLRLL